MIEPMNSFFCFLSSVSSKDFDSHYNRARIDQLEDALRTLGILPLIRAGLYGSQQRNFVAAIVRFCDENEPCFIDTRNAKEWNNRGYSSTYIDYLDSMQKQGLISYNRITKVIRPKDTLKCLCKLDDPDKAIIAA
jgi:hypothetical protein